MKKKFLPLFAVLFAFVFALALASLITFLFERPIARALRRRTKAEK